MFANTLSGKIIFLGTTSKPNRRLTSSSVRFWVVVIVKNNRNWPEPDGTASQPADGFWSRPLGDFNVHVNKPKRADVARYLSSLEGIGFHQHVVGPTHISGNTLDHVMSRTDENLVLQCTVGTRLSDHNAIHCKLNVEKPSDQKEVIFSRKVKDIDSMSFESDFHSTLIYLKNNNDDVVEMY